MDKAEIKARIIVASFILALSLFSLYMSYSLNDTELFQQFAIGTGTDTIYPLKLMVAMFFIIGIMGLAGTSTILFGEDKTDYEKVN